MKKRNENLPESKANAGVKETTEMHVLIAAGGNTFVDIKDDPSVTNILSELLQNFQKGQRGIEGIGNIPAESANATIADKESRLAAVKAELATGKMNALTQYDFAHGMHGIQCIMDAIFRAGVKHGEVRAAHLIATGQATAEEIIGDVAE